MSKFFTSSTVDDLIELAKKPVDYSSFDDINALESIVSLINDEIDKSRGL